MEVALAGFLSEAFQSDDSEEHIHVQRQNRVSYICENFVGAVLLITFWSLFLFALHQVIVHGLVDIRDPKTKRIEIVPKSN